MKAVNVIRDDVSIDEHKLPVLQGYTMKLVEQNRKLSQAKLNSFYIYGYN